MAMLISCWQDPPQSLSLDSNELHLWRIFLPVCRTTQLLLKSTLSPDERARAERLLDPKKAADFVAARGRLRQILGNYLNFQPAELAFSYSRKGKPALHADFSSTLGFNLAHSGEWALLAVAADTAVGVDLEQIDPRIDCRKIAAHFFDPAEKIIFNKFSEQRRRRGFYRIWTRKEAGLKRSGRGFSADPAADSTDTAGQSQVLPIWKHYLGAISVSEKISYVQRYQLIEK